MPGRQAAGREYQSMSYGEAQMAEYAEVCGEVEQLMTTVRTQTLAAGSVRNGMQQFTIRCEETKECHSWSFGLAGLNKYISQLVTGCCVVFVFTTGNNLRLHC